MEKYITIDEINKKYPFVKVAFTTSKVDMANKEDRKTICEELGFNFESMTNNKQIHSGIVNTVHKEDIGVIRDGDALITNLTNVPLITFVADCVSIGFIDPVKGAIGVAHAGWRGTYENISSKVLQEMKENYDSKPQDVLCVIGPSIGPCCYEVSDELIEKFNTNITIQNEKFYIIKEGKSHLDLWKINEITLEKSGILRENIFNLSLCTSCNEDMFHSYRKHNQTSKRLGMIIGLI
jgi:YfiH family protein